MRGIRETSNGGRVRVRMIHGLNISHKELQRVPQSFYQRVNDESYHNKWHGGKLHGNISQNGYGNAIIGRYGGCFEEMYKVAYV